MQSDIVLTKKQGGSRFLTLLIMCVYAGAAQAQSLPWEGPLCTFANALTGKTAFALAVIVFFATSVALLWGEEIKGVMKALVVVFMLISVLIGGSAIIRWLWPSVIPC